MSAAQATGFYRFEAKIISRGGGRSLVASAAYRTGGKSAASAAAYRAGVQLTDERTGISYDYTKKRGIMGAEIMLPNGAPAWMQDRAALWNAVEASEKRKDAQTARDYLLSIPHQLSPEQRRALTKWFVAEQFTSKGYAADIAWHSPDSREGLNHHAHIMVTLRRVEGNGFARTKDRAPPGLHPMKVWKDDLLRLREAWAHSANRFLEAAGLDVRITHESLKSRGIDAEPEPKLGPIAMQMERNGRESFAGHDRREVVARNAERIGLKVELAKAIVEEAKLIDLLAHPKIGNRGMQNERPADELMRQQPERERHRLQTLRDLAQQKLSTEAEEDKKRAARYCEQAAQNCEAGKKLAAGLASAAAKRADEGLEDAHQRYSLALASDYDMRDPYGSLAKAAMTEYGMFLRGQDKLRQEMSKESDPLNRREIELRRNIAANEYMAITSDRLAGLSMCITGKDSSFAELDRERATQYLATAQTLRKERHELIVRQQEEQQLTSTSERTIGEQTKGSRAQNPRSPDCSPDQRSAQTTGATQNQTSQSGRPGEASMDTTRANEDGLVAQATGRAEGEAEVTDAAQTRRHRMRQNLTEGMASKNTLQKGIDHEQSQSR